MRKLLIIPILTALAIAGCGGSSDHTSQWSKADVAKLESEVDNTASSSLSATDRACYVKGVEASFSPSVLAQQAPSAAQSDKLTKILASCGLSRVSYSGESSPAASTAPAGEGGTYGPACKESLTSGSCAEEEGRQIDEAVRQGEAKREAERQEEQTQTEETNTYSEATTSEPQVNPAETVKPPSRAE
jgi:predicted  nucleic acid-binding Zn-ribbon protein